MRTILALSMLCCLLCFSCKQNQPEPKYYMPTATAKDMLKHAQGYKSANDSIAAAATYKKVIKDFPSSEEAKTAAAELLTLQDDIKKQMAFKEKFDKQGYAAYGFTNVFKTAWATVKVKSVQRKREWLHDRYGDTQPYYMPEKGSSFVVAEVSVTSDDKDVVLPAFFLYAQDDDDDTLSMVGFGAMDYRFVKWQNHRTYIGLEGDAKNDFRYSNTVNFTIGTQVSTNQLDSQQLYLIAYKQPCFYRTETNNKPAIEYEFGNCAMPPYLLTPDVITQDYIFIKQLGK